MRLTHKLSIVSVLITLFLSAPTRADAPAPTQLAVINVVKVFASLDQKKDGDAEIDKLDKDIDDKRRKMEKDMQTLSDSLKPGAPFFKPDSPQYKETQDQLLDATANYEAFLRASETRHLMLVKIKTSEIYRAINNAVEKYAKAKGIALVFALDEIDLNAKNMQELTSKIAMRKLIYANPSFDITNDIIQSMNTEYHLGQK